MTLPTAPPAALHGPEGPTAGLWVGHLPADLARRVPGRGRTRRWSYAAAATDDGRLAVGAAVVDLGAVGTTFVWLLDRERGDVVRTWDRRVPGWRLEVPAPDEPARATPGRDRVAISPTGGLLLAIDDFDGQPLHVDLEAEPMVPVTCTTPTPAGGWNSTEKAAGHAVTGQVGHGDRLVTFAGRGWRDWTVGRQDRHTTWRWAAGAGTSTAGQSVGLNCSTGMNASGPGEDVAWIDGRAVALEVTTLGPTTDGAFDGPWRVEGPGWGLDFRPVGTRAADENLVLVRSSYVQPVGTFHGTLPDGEGGTIAVDGLPGVTEDHEARW